MLLSNPIILSLWLGDTFRGFDTYLLLDETIYTFHPPKFHTCFTISIFYISNYPESTPPHRNTLRITDITKILLPGARADTR